MTKQKYYPTKAPDSVANLAEAEAYVEALGEGVLMVWIVWNAWKWSKRDA